MSSEPESPRIVQDDDLISAVPNFLEPNGYYERMLNRHQGFDIPRGELAMFRAERAGLRRSAPGGRQAITHPDQLPSDELFDGSEEAFLRRL
jgi:hypothetical protein